jgi:hypothetical protein
MNQKYLFLSIDSYAHIKRNIFGFKNRKGVTEQRPCSLAVIASVDSVMDTIYTASFKGAKIKDDPDYKSRPIDPAYYGHPKSESEIYEQLNIMKRSTREKTFVIQDNAREIFVDLVRKFDGNRKVDYLIAPSFTGFMRFQARYIPTIYFADAMNNGLIEGHYNMRERELSGRVEIDDDIKFELLQTHIRYPKFSDSDRALTNSIKMNEAYTLVCSIVNKYK